MKAKEEEPEVQSEDSGEEEQVVESDSELDDAHVQMIKALKEEVHTLKHNQTGEFQRMQEEISQKFVK